PILLTGDNPQIAQAIAQQLVATGTVEHPFLGIQMVTITPELKEQIRQQTNTEIPADKGVAIMKVVPNSPAAQGDLQAGDVIQSLQGQPIESADQVQDLVSKTPVGDELTVGVLRNGQPQTLTVKVGVLPNR
ncbi:MAG: PDZ domain-containing protein, partial [Prochlorothrix sp.]